MAMLVILVIIISFIGCSISLNMKDTTEIAKDVVDSNTEIVVEQDESLSFDPPVPQFSLEIDSQ